MTDSDRSFDLGGYASQIQGPDDRIIIGRLNADGQMSDSPFRVMTQLDYPFWFRAVHLGSSDERVSMAGWRVDWRLAAYEGGFTVEDRALAGMEPGTNLYRYRTPSGMLWVAYAPVD